MDRARTHLGADSRWLEAASGTAAMGWAAAVLLAPDRLARLAGYAPLVLFISPRLISMLMLLGGCLQCLAALRNHVVARVQFAGALGGAWLLIAYANWLGVPQPPTMWVLAALGVWNGLAMVNLVRLSLLLRRP